MRMLDASPGITMSGEADEFIDSLRTLFHSRAAYQAKWADEGWPRHRIAPETGDWKQSIRDMLKGWVCPQRGDTHYGVRIQTLEREGRDGALLFWSWLLDVWPDAKIIFLTRDQGKIELSMMVTPKLKWVPNYGRCIGCCGTNVFLTLKAMSDFHFLNPRRTALLDYEELLDLPSLYPKLAEHGVVLSPEHAEAELAIVSGSTREIGMKPNGKVGTPEFDVSHPQATFQQVQEHLRLIDPDMEGMSDPIDEVDSVRGSDPEEAVTDMGWLPPEQQLPELSISIMAHPSRKEHVAKLLAALPEETVVSEDEGIGIIANCARSWEMHSPYADYHLVLQDDAILCAHFIQQAREFLGSLKEPSVVSFYHGGSKRRAPWLNQLATHMRNGRIEAPIRWGPAICIPTKWIPEMLEHFHAGDSRHDDDRIGDWLESKGRKCIYPLPCLIDHLHTPSLVGHGKGARKAVAFLGNDSADFPAEPHYPENASPFDRRPALPQDYTPRKPAPFQLRAPLHPRAIVYPWLARGAVWEELRYSIRSLEMFFEDKDCPIYILGEAAPPWLKKKSRVKWVEIKEYAPVRKGSRKLNVHAGLFAARTLGLQLADEVLWMNDDFYLLQSCDWNTFRTALACGDITRRAHPMLESDRDFLQGKARAAFDLMMAGKNRVLDFAVHAPMRFERLKAIDVLSRFHTGHRGGFATLYHNWNDSPWQNFRGLLAKSLPAPDSARTLNHPGRGPDDETKRRLQALFWYPSKSEREDMPPMAVPEPPGPVRALFVLATDGGEASAHLFSQFLLAGVECLALRYADKGVLPEGVRVIDDKGGKFQMAQRHLTPEFMAAYDYLFLWDDDLQLVPGFDPAAFLAIMAHNDLGVAQPALTVDSPHSHAITLKQEGLGRRTNFVEIMAPVFTRKAWLRVHADLDPDNFSGWGYDYMPRLGRKGIIDAMPVRHLRPVQSGNSERSHLEMQATMQARGWKMCQPEDIRKLDPPVYSALELREPEGVTDAA